MDRRPLLPLVLLLAGCSQGASNHAAPPPAPVVVSSATSESFPLEITAIGGVQAPASVALKSRVGGILDKVLFTEGDRVRTGQVLLEIDRRPYEVALRSAQASLESARARADFTAAEAKRYEELAKSSVASAQDLEQRRSDAAQAVAGVDVARAAVASAELNLAYTRLTSPMDGRSGQLQLHVGDLVKADSDNAIVTIRQISPAQVTFAVPERYLADIRSRAAAGPLSVWVRVGGVDAPMKGTLTFVDNAVNTSTGTIALKATFANEDEKLWPGSFVDAVLRLGTLDRATVIPTQALQTGQQGTYVFVVDKEEKAQVRPVETGPRSGERIVVTRGVEPGEVVVVDGQLRLGPGTKVAIKGQAPPAAQARTSSADPGLAP